ncbi:uncharacterized protein LOC112350653 [Selaginella moellendorffii]|uniref:uncharacterized protein LOC112350653 n=1 Tax=Selaginella moellendorffii TaxID=88036 RepID=UPI000D1C4501|nr:uncharacterized protein LOC112350653 [Selaginella moellendorffii]|eukprot:XP_024542996.1 uncharacterized protein LOC112350653 [Selaginella moellendorffii]
MSCKSVAVVVFLVYMVATASSNSLSKAVSYKSCTSCGNLLPNPANSCCVQLLLLGSAVCDCEKYIPNYDIQALRSALVACTGQDVCKFAGYPARKDETNAKP